MSNILLVDDTPDVRTTLGGMLSEAGHSVQTADSESEALEAISRFHFEFALIDVRLHGEDEKDESGMTLALALRQLRPQLRIILLTAFVRSKQIVRAVRYYGIVHFFDKGDPNCAAQILDTITSTQEDTKSPAWNETTHLSLALTNEQHTYARAAGQHVLSTRSNRQLQLKVARYAARADNSLRDLERFRVDAAALGDELWREVIEDHPEIKETYRETVVGDQRLTLLFETPRELLQLPLEFMRSNRPADYLVLQHPVARLVLDTVPKRPALSPTVLATTNPTQRLNMLLIASNTKPPIPGVENEVRILTNFVARNYPWISTRVLATEEATYSVVQRALSSTEYDIIHYAGHGCYDSQSPEESSLFFWSERNQRGTVIALTAAEMKLLLSQSHARLVYLSCCQGTQSSSESNLVRDDFLGLADAVVQAGIPTVIGYRCPVRDDSAPKLAQAFYESLFENGRPEVALWRARVKLATNRNDPTWLSPILIHQA